ncbi:MAG TPA: protein kinase [Actinomycetota bacterium]
MADPALAPGVVLSDRYTLKKEEWSTPLGPVWLARDSVLDRAVFVHVLSAELRGDPRVARAFQRAAASCAQIDHPGLTRVFDIGENPPFVVFEHAAGGRLSDRLRAGPMRESDAARVVLSVARGLEALHERGLAHLDIAPGTVLFDAEGRAKLLTVYGPAAEIWPEARAEQPPGYRTPELDPLPAEQDRYALAALTLHLLTGRAPEPGSVRPKRGVGSGFESILRRALGPDPAQRPDPDEFVAALAPLARVELKGSTGPRFSASEFRWLIPAIAIVALAAVAVTFGVAFVRDLAARSESTAEPTPTEQATPGRPLDFESVSEFDPPPGDGTENPDQLAYVTDGKAATSWRTLDYASITAAPKTGIGLLFDLGEETRIGAARVQATLEGWHAEIRVSNAAGSAPEDFDRIAGFRATFDRDVPLPEGTRARYVLLWIDRLTEGGSEYPYRAELAEFELFAP